MSTIIKSSAVNGNTIKLLSFNIQVAIATVRPHHYVTQSWKHVLPHSKQIQNLDAIADLVAEYDIVGLQEVDAGSLRSENINQTEYLAHRAEFPYWYHQTNRRLGRIAQHSNGLLCKFDPYDIMEHKLPGPIPGRGAMVVRYGDEQNPLVIVLLHLALGRRARMRQLEYIGELVRIYDHLIVMGDMNCQADSQEMQQLLSTTGLLAPAGELNTYPSWRPTRKLDHILVSPSLVVKDFSVINVNYSDHLPISMEVEVPSVIKMVA